MCEATKNKLVSIHITIILIFSGFIGMMSLDDSTVSGIEFEGFITTDTTWTKAQSPYIIVGDVEVEHGAALTIEPGVEVKFNDYYNLFVEGNLSAVGTSLEKIIIKSNRPSPDWEEWPGITVNSTGHIEIRYCEINHAGHAIELESSSNNSITSNNLRYNRCSLRLVYGANYNNISNNSLIYNEYSIKIYASSHNIFNNNIIDNSQSTLGGYRVSIYESTDTTITNNTFTNNGVYIFGDTISEFNSHNIINNTVNNKFLYYLKNTNGFIIDGESIGQLIIANCTNVNVSNLQINNSNVGIEVAFSTQINLSHNVISWINMTGIFITKSSYINLSYNEFSYNSHGISLRYAEDCNFNYNNFSENSDYGFHSDYSQNIGMMGNHFENDGINIYGNSQLHYNTHDIPANNLVNGKPVLYYKNLNGLTLDNATAGQIIIASCENVDVRNITINEANMGALIAYSSHIGIINNSITSNRKIGLSLYKSSSIEITQNSLSDNEAGIGLKYCSYINITSNDFTKNNGDSISVHLSSNNSIESNYFMNNYYGLSFYYGDYNNITGNNFVNCSTAIKLQDSSLNNITYNKFSENQYGTSIIMTSSYNRIYHNIFLNSVLAHAHASGDNNYWNASYPLGGNYWSDFEGVDKFHGLNQDIIGSDNIIDTPYLIDSPHTNFDTYDYYPLVEPIPDTLAPRIQLLNPQNNSVFLPGEVLSFEVKEGNLDTVYYSINGGPDQSFTTLYNISTASWDHGSYTIAISAEDINENLAQRTYKFSVDTKAPEIIFNSPGNNSIVYPPSRLNFSIEDANLEYVEYSVNSGIFVQLNSPFDIISSNWDDGKYRILINAEDVFGHSNSSWFNVTFDSTPPAITNIEVAPDYQKESGYVAISADVADVNGVQRVWVQITDPDNYNMDNFTMTLDSQNNRYYLNQTYDILGEYQFLILASDILDNIPSAGSTGTFTITNKPGTPRDFKCDAGENSVKLTWSSPATDGGYSITNYRIYRGTAYGVELYLTEVGNILTYTDINVTYESTYYYRISAVNINGEGRLSESISATPKEPETPSGGAIGLGSITDNWLLLMIVIAIVICAVIATVIVRNRKEKQQPIQESPKTVSERPVEPEPTKPELHPPPEIFSEETKDIPPPPPPPPPP